MKLGLLVFGQFRAWEDVFDENLKQIQKEFESCDVDVYVLTDKNKGSMYSEYAEKYIRDSIKLANFQIKRFEFWEDLPWLHETDVMIRDYAKTLLKDKIPADDRNNWTMNHWYRRYCLWKLVEENPDWQNYDFFVFLRLFDARIKILRPLLPLLNPSASYSKEKDTLYMCIDMTFIGSPSNMKKLLQIGTVPFQWTDFEWTPEFYTAFNSFDSCLANQRMTFCSEAQVFHYIYLNFPKWKNIRYDFNATLSPSHAESYIDIRIARHMSIPRKIISIGSPAKTNEFPTYAISEEESIQFLRTNFPQFIPYETPTRPLGLAGIKPNSPEFGETPTLVAYLWLYIHGGFYVSSLEPLASLRQIYEITELSDMLVAVDTAGNLSSDFIASTPGNPALLSLIEDTVKGITPRILQGLVHFQKKNNIFTFLTQEGICYGNQLILRKP